MTNEVVLRTRKKKQLRKKLKQKKSKNAINMFRCNT